MKLLRRFRVRKFYREVHAMRRLGYSDREIASSFNMSPTQMRRKLRP